MSVYWDGTSWVDYGTVRTVEPTEFPLEVAYLRDQVLRTAGGVVEDAHIETLLRAAVEACEYDTREQLLSQGWEQSMSGFPSTIVLQRNPVLSVEGIDYLDGDGVTQTLSGGSPADFTFIPATVGRKARIMALAGASWPATFSQANAVTVRFTCGYASVDQIPATYLNGICAWVAETYKQRSVSVQNTIQNVPAVFGLERFWKPRFRAD